MDIKYVLKVVCAVFLMQPIFASESSPLNELPTESLYPIIASAYANYDDPIEFTYLKTVSKTWYAITQTPHFKKLLQEKGFAEPVMVFYCVGFHQRTPDFLKKDLRTDDILGLETEMNKIAFHYKDPTELAVTHIDTLSVEKFDGLFWRGAETNLAIWVNPSTTYVFNSEFSRALSRDDDKYHKSKMSLTRYITQYEKGKKLEATDTTGTLQLIMDPITAEPCLKPFKPAPYTYDTLYAEIPIDAPVLAKRFVKKWPKSFKFSERNLISFLDDYPFFS